MMFIPPISQAGLREFLFSVWSYQFDPQVAQAFLQKFSQMKFDYSSKTKKLKYIKIQKRLYMAYKPQTGTFSLTLDSAQDLLRAIAGPKYRITILNDVQEYIMAGKSVFTQHVVSVDPTLHVGEEVVVVNQDGKMLAIGKLSLPPSYITAKVSGSCVKVRKGIDSWNTQD